MNTDAYTNLNNKLSLSDLFINSIDIIYNALINES